MDLYLHYYSYWDYDLNMHRRSAREKIGMHLVVGIEDLKESQEDLESYSNNKWF